MKKQLLILIFPLLAMPALAQAQTTAPTTSPSTATTFTRTQDIVYGRAFGTALTMDRFAPTSLKPNGAAIIVVVSGGWVANHDAIGGPFIQLFIRPFLDRGYTVFAVVPGSQPKFTIPEIAQHIDRSVHFIRGHAEKLKIDPDRIGITGGSAGGHLSLLQATSPTPAKRLSLDRAEQVSGKVQAVAVFFPPTDFLNWGRPGHIILDDEMIPPFLPSFDYHEMDGKTHRLERLTDEKRVRALLRETSPLYHVTADTPPTLIVHGDKDTLVPIQQAQVFIDKCREAEVECELFVKEGGGHGWMNMQAEVERMADWFDKHLAPKM